MDNKKVRKINNKGFSLLELIIAVAILAAISAPLLRNFVLGVQVNLNARNEMKATTAAQNLMESIKASKTSEPDKIQKLLQDLGMNPNYSVVGEEDIYTITDVKVDHSLYDAKVIINPQKYSVQNNVSVPNIAVLDKEVNAVFSRSYEQDQERLNSVYRTLYQDFLQLYHQSSRTSSDSALLNSYISHLFYNLNSSDYEDEAMAIMSLRRLGLFQREIRLEIDKVTEDRQVVYGSYLYKCNHSFVVDRLDKLSTDFDHLESSVELSIPLFTYDNIGSAGKLEAIYLFYAPNYYWSSNDIEVAGKAAMDKIIIENPDNYEDVEVFIIKQQANTDVLSSQYPIKELESVDSIYQVELEILERPEVSNPSWNITLDTLDTYIQLRTNLEESFCSDKKFIGINAPVRLTYGNYSGGTISGTYRASDSYELDYGKLRNALSYNNIQRLGKEDRIFGVEVQIYKKDTVASGRPEDMLFKLDGSKVN